MGSYYQNRLVEVNCENSDEMTFQPSAIKFLDGQKLANTEHFGLYRLIEARTNPAYDYNHSDKGVRQLKIYTICDYDEPENVQCHWVSELSAADRHTQRYFALDNIAQYNHLTGYVTCIDAGQYFDFSELINADIAHMMQQKPNQHGYISSLLSPIAILTRQQLYSCGGGDHDFRFEADNLKQLVGAWRGKEVCWLDNAPSQLTNITQNLLVFA